MNLQNFVYLFFICCACHSCNSQENKKVNQDNLKVKDEISTIDIDSLYLGLSGNRNLPFNAIQGQFVYEEKNVDKGEHLARFISESIEQTIKHTSYSDNKKDVLSLGSTDINLKAKIDPLSIKIYSLLFKEKQYLIFVGKSQSASGSGVQVTYFNIIRLNAKKKVENQYEFESRFGDVHNICDYNEDGVLDYFKIVNGKNNGEYQLTVNDIQSNSQINNGYILLRYELDDKFVLLKDSLLRK